MKKFTAASQKGGVGKTTTNCHFAYAQADYGERTLVVNGDEQGGTNNYMGEYQLTNVHTHHLFGSEPLNLPMEMGNLVLIASDRDAMRELEQSDIDDIELVTNLRARLAELAPHFDWAVFDTAGANSRIANAFLIVSDYVTVPTKIDEESIDEAVATMGRIGGIRAHPDSRVRNEGLTFLGLLVNEYDARQPFQVSKYNEMKEAYGDYTVPYPITDRQAYREAASARVPVWRLKDESGKHVKTAARDAGKEIITVIAYFRKIFAAEAQQ